MFGKKIAFYPGGCKTPDNKPAYSAGMVLESFSEGINVVHDFSHNYYHLTGEMPQGEITLVVNDNSTVEKIFKVLRLENCVKDRLL